MIPHQAIVSGFDRNSLTEAHRDHLRSEGFSEQQIDFLILGGVRSIASEEARDLGLLARCEKLGRVVYPSGLYFPFRKTFGQVRCDDPPIRKGKPAKYITTAGAKAEPFLPPGTKVVTEGYKDAAAGTHHGGMITGAIAGVSHYKCLPKGSGLTIVFDADGWTNPQVFANLIHAGFWLNGKVSLLPEIPEHPKAGLCEFFKSGRTAEDYKKLAGSALKPGDLLQEWPDHWDNLTDAQIVRNCKKVICLAAIYLPDLESEVFIRTLGERFRAKGIRVRDLQRLAKKTRARNSKVTATVPLVSDYEKVLSRFGKDLRFNSLLNRPELRGEPFPAEDARFLMLVEERIGLDSGKEDCADIVLNISRKRTYSPVVEYLEKCSKEFGDETSILDGLAQRYFGNPESIAQTQLTKTLIRAVARAYEPGCKADEATVLAGGQGYGKSQFLKVLASPDWFCDDFSDPRDKDHLLKLHEAWIVEWAELHGLTKRESTKVKAFMTCQRDRIRRPYGREAEQMPRPSVILGTSNDCEFLTDPTGNRRWWVIQVSQKIPIDLLNQERDRIWAAAVSLYKSGEPWWLSSDQEAQADEIRKGFEVVDAWSELIEDYIGLREEISVGEIFSECLRVDPGLQDNAKRGRITSILKRLGFQPSKNAVWRHGKKLRVWTKNHLEKISCGETRKFSARDSKEIAVPTVPTVPEGQELDIARVSPGTLLGTLPGTARHSGVPGSENGTAIVVSGTVVAAKCRAVPRSVPEAVPNGTLSEQALQPLGTHGTPGTANSLESPGEKLHHDIGSTATYGGLDIPTAQMLKNDLLTIVAVNGAIATVTTPELPHPIQVPHADLEVDY